MKDFLEALGICGAGVGACSAGIECLNFWLSDDQAAR